MNIYLVLTVFTPELTSITAINKALLFFFMVYVFLPSILKK